MVIMFCLKGWRPTIDIIFRMKVKPLQVVVSVLHGGQV